MSIERFSISEIDWPEFLFHGQRYFFAAKYAVGKRVLDCASGEGYGAAYLATCASDVTGIDISERAITEAASRYADLPNLVFQSADLAELPFPDASFDVVTAFEVIEHVSLDKQAQALIEMRRVLKPDGILLISTPDKDVGQARGYSNPFHLAEMTRNEFETRLRKHFASVRLYSQELNMVSAMWALDGCTADGTNGVSELAELTENGRLKSRCGNDAYYYLFALCGATDVGAPGCHQFAAFRREPAYQLWNRIDRQAEELRRLQETFHISERNNALLARQMVSLQEENVHLLEEQRRLFEECGANGLPPRSRWARLARRYYALYETPTLGRILQTVRRLLSRIYRTSQRILRISAR